MNRESKGWAFLLLLPLQGCASLGAEARLVLPNSGWTGLELRNKGDAEWTNVRVEVDQVTWTDGDEVSVLKPGESKLLRLHVPYDAVVQVRVTCDQGRWSGSARGR